MAKPSKKKQQTLEATLGRPRVKPAVITPRKATPTKGSPSKNSVIAMPPPPSAAASSSSPGGNFITSSQLILSSAKKTRSRPSLAYPKELDQSSSATEDEPPVSSIRQTSKGKEKAIFISEDDDDDEDERHTKRGKSRDKPASISSSSASPSPVKESTPKQKQQAPADSEEESDDLPIVTPVSSRVNRKRRLAVDSDDSDDMALVSSPVKKRRLIRRGSSPVKQQQSDSDEEEVVAPTPRLRSSQTPRKPLSAKEKAREMLRRRRAGETIVEEDGEEEEDEEEDVEPRKALYDTDSDHLALSEFEDEEDEQENEVETPEPSEPDGKKKRKKDKKKKKKKKKLKALKGDSDDEGTEAEAEDLDDFVVEDDSDAPMGAPDDLMQMPLQFTHHARKKLIEHFRDVVEWLVQNKINPGFAEKTAELYRIGWQKLDDEVRALASSKFTSSAWKPDFYKALRARPQYTSIEVGASAHETIFGSNCEACGRSGHPATWTISFSGTPYVKRFGMDFLDPIEPPSDSGSSSQSQSESYDMDEDGNTIAPEEKTFYVGVVCNGNAEIAHTLIHWKHALQDWVESQLMAEGWMQPARLVEREKMKLKRKYKLVDKIVEGWVERGKVRGLFGEFKNQLERARSQQTTGRGYRRG
ncbi:hypothetical protein QC761_706840 [Podospora bellae-mahoneyi]|uniref:DUF4211 domain-containing protein n=1 Tax=Podospora bellae-mahoneyi TaxID=2093777 RepID=A0ABR0F993_9PEZI|nr:hypothetical protein QC761_706840 [Podospora bellae-mahoneyi]